MFLLSIGNVAARLAHFERYHAHALSQEIGCHGLRGCFYSCRHAAQRLVIARHRIVDERENRLQQSGAVGAGTGKRLG